MGLADWKPIIRLFGFALQKGVIVIRQVITCNICGSQKRQTNHWFVAYQETGELRISGWNSLRQLSPETKHLCGEACAHKLISQFLMRSVDLGTQRATDKSETAPAADSNISAPAGGAGPSASTWQGLPSRPDSPRSPDCARRELERLQRSHPRTGRRTS